MFAINNAVKIPAVLEIPVLICNMFLPFLILESWYMCYKSYISLKNMVGEGDEKKSMRRQIRRNIAVLSFMGIVTFVSGLNVVTYISWYWAYFREVWAFAVLLFCWFVAWGICFVKSIMICKTSDVTRCIFKKGKYVIIVLILLMGTMLCSAYSYEQGENAWFYRMVEEAENEFFNG